MRERPILFSAPMVRAILDGKKTQTRRLVKPQPEHRQHHMHDGHVIYDGEHRMWCWKDLVLENLVDFPGNDDRMALAARCPYGQPGDRLWVRETWGLFETDLSLEAPHYRATQGDPDAFRGGWRPSIHMPRRLSRITLEVTGVRVERLQDISGEDSVSEGISIPRCTCDVCVRSSTMCTADASEAAMEYRALWESIHGPGAWDANPWVWVVEFKRVAP